MEAIDPLEPPSPPAQPPTAPPPPPELGYGYGVAASEALVLSFPLGEEELQQRAAALAAAAGVNASDIVATVAPLPQLVEAGSGEGGRLAVVSLFRASPSVPFSFASVSFFSASTSIAGPPLNLRSPNPAVL